MLEWLLRIQSSEESSKKKKREIRGTLAAMKRQKETNRNDWAGVVE
jgi:hypothetical protein